MDCGEGFINRDDPDKIKFQNNTPSNVSRIEYSRIFLNNRSSFSLNWQFSNYFSFRIASTFHAHQFSAMTRTLTLEIPTYILVRGAAHSYHLLHFWFRLYVIAVQKWRENEMFLGILNAIEKANRSNALKHSAVPIAQ